MSDGNDPQQSAARTSKTVAHLREVAERLRIRGDYDNRGSDVADATACTVGADEIERLTRAKADWEECVALRDAEIERLTRERDEWKNGHTMTDLRLTQRIEECERLRAALGRVCCRQGRTR